jgi:hypothetical protein
MIDRSKIKVNYRPIGPGFIRFYIKTSWPDCRADLWDRPRKTELNRRQFRVYRKKLAYFFHTRSDILKYKLICHLHNFSKLNKLLVLCHYKATVPKNKIKFYLNVIYLKCMDHEKKILI